MRYSGRDIQSHLNKHIETGHETLDIKDYKVIGNRYRNTIFKQKIAEAFKELKPTINMQEKSVQLKLFN